MPQTVFITGGSSGIGAGLAKAFHKRGAKVIIGGRSLDGLAMVARDCGGMECVEIDVAVADSVRACAAAMAVQYPQLDMVINNAGIQRLIDFTEPHADAATSEEIDTNLKGTIAVTQAFLPLLRRQTAAVLVNVSSALAFAPLAKAPIYCATKAAVHSFTMSLREQLKNTNVRIVELIPPLVETNLHRGQPRGNRSGMPLDAFVEASMKGLDSGREELLIGGALALRIASRIAPKFIFSKINSH